MAPSAPRRRLQLALLCVAVLCAATAAWGQPQGKFKRAKDIQDCKTCVSHGYGWCPIRRRCGHFASKTCSGTSTDFSEGAMVQTVDGSNWRRRLYDERRTTFVLFHSEIGKAQAVHTMRTAVKTFGKSEAWIREGAVFASVNHDRYPEVAQAHGIEIHKLPALAALNIDHRPDEAWAGLPAFEVATKLPFVPRFNFRQQHEPNNYVGFFKDIVQSKLARIPELDALIPRFMDAATGGEGNATLIYQEAQQIVADLVGDLVTQVEAASAELERQRAEYEAAHPTESDGSSDGAVEVAADGSAVATAAGDDGAKAKPLLESAAISRLRTITTGADGSYLSIMEAVVDDGVTSIVRELNELRQMPTPRPLEIQYRMQVLEVFVRELF